MKDVYELYPNKRWLRFKKGRMRVGIDLEEDNVADVAEVVNYSWQESMIKCYQGVVSGAKAVDS